MIWRVDAAKGDSSALRPHSRLLWHHDGAGRTSGRFAGDDFGQDGVEIEVEDSLTEDGIIEGGVHFREGEEATVVGEAKDEADVIVIAEAGERRLENDGTGLGVVAGTFPDWGITLKHEKSGGGGGFTAAHGIGRAAPRGRGT